MNPKLQALFYLAALVCFVVATAGFSGRKKLSLLPLGLALWLFPTFWTTFKAAF